MAPPASRKKETAQEAFKKLREKTKAEMREKMQKIEEAQEVAAAKSKVKKTKAKDINATELVAKEPTASAEKAIESDKESRNEVEETREINDAEEEFIDANPISRAEPVSEPLTAPVLKHEDRVGSIKRKSAAVQTHIVHQRSRGTCSNCCGGLPEQGPGSGHVDAMKDSEFGIRLRGGGDKNQSVQTNFENNSETRNISFSCNTHEGSRTTSRNVPESCGYSPSMSVELCDKRSRSSCGACGTYSPPDSFQIRNERNQGGCGTCGSSPQTTAERFHRSPTDPYQQYSVELINRQSCLPSPLQPRFQACSPSPACRKQRELGVKGSWTSIKGCCPCGGCGGFASSHNPGELAGDGSDGADGGCCGGSRPQGLSCKCECQSYSTHRPIGGCGGQSCGRIYSCAGSSGGRSCFPRNYKRRSGADCCGSADSNCGGCC